MVATKENKVLEYALRVVPPLIGIVAVAWQLNGRITTLENDCDYLRRDLDAHNPSQTRDRLAQHEEATRALQALLESLRESNARLTGMGHGGIPYPAGLDFDLQDIRRRIADLEK